MIEEEKNARWQKRLLAVENRLETSSGNTKRLESSCRQTEVVGADPTLSPEGQRPPPPLQEGLASGVALRVPSHLRWPRSSRLTRGPRFLKCS